MRDHLPHDLLHQPSTEDIKRISSLLYKVALCSKEKLQRTLCPLIKQAQIAPGGLTLTLNTNEVCDWLKIDPVQINSSCLCFKIPFQFKKRGVETKLVIDTKANAFMDPVLIRNLAKAHRCLQALKKGSSFDDIACSQNFSKARLLQLIDHALLAPDIVRSILQGDQPTGLTSDWLQRTPLPLDWEHQRKVIATL